LGKRNAGRISPTGNPPTAKSLTRRFFIDQPNDLGLSSQDAQLFSYTSPLVALLTFDQAMAIGCMSAGIHSALCKLLQNLQALPGCPPKADVIDRLVRVVVKQLLYLEYKKRLSN
jgi:hypothetical protein